MRFSNMAASVAARAHAAAKVPILVDDNYLGRSATTILAG
jgi:hypothetical protein